MTVPTAYGYACPDCGGTKAEIEGWIVGKHAKEWRGMLLWCVKCEHRWEQQA